MRYTLIHPTKSGGTSIENFFYLHYRSSFRGMGHASICKNNNNPIIVVRDVKSRFLSMYKYWKNGSVDMKNFKRSEEFKKCNENVSIIDFINILKTNPEELCEGFTWSAHFRTTCSWIDKKTDYKNIIVITYETELNPKIQKLINILGIENKNIPLPKNNVSVPIYNENDLLDDPIVDDFINDYFKDDITLINTIKNNPELFKLVI